MTTPLVLSSVDGAVARLTLNDPDRANVLSLAMMDALEAALSDAVASNAVRVIVLGAAGRIFCAGHDLGELSSANAAQATALFERCARLVLAIGASRAPVIARVDGAAV